MTDIKKMEFSDETGQVNIERSNGTTVKYNMADVVTASTNSSGVIGFDAAGQAAVRAAITDTSPSLPDDVVRLTSEGTVTASPCVLKRIRCVSGTSIAITVYDSSIKAGYVALTATLSAGQEATIPDGGIRCMTGVMLAFTGTATFDVSLGAWK